MILLWRQARHAGHKPGTLPQEATGPATCGCRPRPRGRLLYSCRLIAGSWPDPEAARPNRRLRPIGQGDSIADAAGAWALTMRLGDFGRSAIFAKRIRFLAMKSTKRPSPPARAILAEQTHLSLAGSVGHAIARSPRPAAPRF